MAPAVPALIAAALIMCVAVLMGWFTNSLEIAGFGRNEIFMQPWTAVACIGLSLSVFSGATGRLSAARLIAILPLVISLATLILEWVDAPMAMDRWLFPDHILGQSRIYPGRPGLMPAIATFLLTLASLAATSRYDSLKRFVTMLGCLALSVAVISGTLLPLGVSSMESTTRRTLMSVPTASTLIAIAVALIAQRRHVAWPGNPCCGINSRTLQWMLAPCILLPVTSALWQLWIYKNGQLTREMAEIIQAAMQVSISCAIVAWAWVRIGRESTARWAFSTAIDSAPIAITDINGRIIRWSKGCERLYGWTAKEAQGQRKHQLTDALIPQGPKRPLAPHTAQEAEITERRRNGTRLRILESREIVQPRPDIAPMIVLSMTDITERQRAEQAMLASEARLTFAADLHELGLFEWQQSTDKIEFSQHAKRLFQLPAEDFSGGMEAWRSHIRAHFGIDILSEESLSASLQRRAFRLCSMNADQPLIVEGSIFFHEPPGDQGLSMLGIIMDATEREQRTEMLKAREFELRSILETVPEAMITVDEAGRVRSFSTAAEKLFGYRAEEITGRDVRTLLPDYAKPAAADDRMPPPRESTPQTTAGRDRQGNSMPLELVVGETRIGREHISIAFVRSLREQIATQTRLNELREQLLHASRVSTMGEMGAGLAHELNQPLTATANFLGAAHMRLDMNASADQIRELIDLANLEVLRAGEMIRRMRAFVAKGELDIRSCPLNELIADALQLAWSGSRHAGVNLHYQPSMVDPNVLADPIQIQQVLVNIIGNALEAFAARRTEKPEIMISTTQRPDGHVLIRLKDNGPGFPSPIIGRPFEAFVSTRPHGLGLGLSICRRIVEGHGGVLTLANGPEGGAIIEFTLPVYREPGDSELKAAE
ncbi:PAS domain-containing sensor histidine kinase [Sphingobium lactosutens]|uniref:PAS domain-containing sensor histidine kinase n=1 Tax=Sphingobium lactosutens TaxID=522773 RepID=UPI0015B86D93|nr:PAS domain S-box protein [Sphingobium lactosutens]